MQNPGARGGPSPARFMGLVDVDDNGGQSPYGPVTSVSLFGMAQALGARCSCDAFIPILTILVLGADAVLAIFAGLDLLDRGTGAPWVQFSLSISVAAIYLALLVATFVQYRWERVLRYRYHWLLALLIVTVLAWTNFGVWASWQGRFRSNADGVSPSDGTAFIAWVGANAVGLAGFFVRFATILLAQGLRYTYHRVIELQAIVLSHTTGGRRLADIMVAGGSAVPPSAAAAASWGRGRARRNRSPHARRFAGTQWAKRQYDLEA